jgi:hypothetical protein
MAKTKKKKRVSGTRRHRRVGAIKPGGVEHYALLGLGAIAGGLAGAFGVQAISTALGSTATNTPWLPGFLIGGGGLGVAALTKGNAIGEGFGLGLGSMGVVLGVNAAGFLNVPGISGMAFRSNAGPANNVIRKAVGQAPGPFINKTVGAMSRRQRAMGALATN